MNFIVDSATPQRIVGRLRDGSVETEVSAWGAAQAVFSLVTALEAARDDGYGECFWPEVTGQYWWMCRREGRRLEVVVLWSSGAGMGWQHVYRSTDEIDYFIDCVQEQLAAHDLFPLSAIDPAGSSET